MAAISLEHGRRQDWGVVVGRFQVPDLTPGHRHLLDTAIARHSNVLVVIGERPARRQRNHALDYELRAMMVRSCYPSAHVVKLNDVGDNESWNIRLNELVATHTNGCGAVLYGGRQSFIDTYVGDYNTCDVGLSDSLSGTEVRFQAAAHPINSANFRAGVIYAVTNDYPVSYQAVDVAVLATIKNVQHVLLGRRHALAKQWHLIGGIADPDDESLEETGVRELAEETHLIVNPDSLQYVCSKKVRDWRYVDGPDDIKTVLYVTSNWSGTPTVTDEMVELRWCPLATASSLACGTHAYLLERLAKKIQ